MKGMIKDMTAIKLTQLTKKGGCGCKIGPAALRQVLDQLPPQAPNPKLLVGLDTGDDAGVYQLNETTALVQTVDFFTPIVDDPYDFGQIAAANALSDVYAMGGQPITALNIVAFPISVVDSSVLAQILRGASDKLNEAGVTLVGGHSIDDAEPKFGLAVTGIIDPSKVKTNAQAQTDDQLILTKPIGVGILTTALKNGWLDADEIKLVTQTMATLNKTAAEVMQDYDVSACTDVTGFGLLGHALEMARESKRDIVIEHDQVPFLPNVKSLAKKGAVPGGSKNNLNHVAPHVDFAESLDDTDRLMLADAVTSGGLLIAVKHAEHEAFLQDLKKHNVPAARIGYVSAAGKGQLIIR